MSINDWLPYGLIYATGMLLMMVVDAIEDERAGRPYSALDSFVVVGLWWPFMALLYCLALTRDSKRRRVAATHTEAVRSFVVAKRCPFCGALSDGGAKALRAGGFRAGFVCGTVITGAHDDFRVAVGPGCRREEAPN